MLIVIVVLKIPGETEKRFTVVGELKTATKSWYKKNRKKLKNT